MYVSMYLCVYVCMWMIICIYVCVCTCDVIIRVAMLRQSVSSPISHANTLTVVYLFHDVSTSFI